MKYDQGNLVIVNIFIDKSKKNYRDKASSTVESFGCTGQHQHKNMLQSFIGSLG